MNEITGVLALLLFIYIGLKSRAIQSSFDQVASVVQNKGSDIPPVQIDFSDQWTDPSEVNRLINGSSEHFDIPGQFGVLQRNHVTTNNNQMPTYGTNYSKSFT